MTSILFEAGFLTNAEEEKFLNSEAGQKKIVESFILALNDYKTKLEENPQLAKVKTKKQNQPGAQPVAQQTAPSQASQNTDQAPEMKVIKTVAELEREEAQAKENLNNETAAPQPKIEVADQTINEKKREGLEF